MYSTMCSVFTYYCTITVPSTVPHHTSLWIWNLDRKITCALLTQTILSNTENWQDKYMLSLVYTHTHTPSTAKSSINLKIVLSYSNGLGSVSLQLNRSDSDSCVPMYRRAPFQRGTAERRSLRWKGRLGGSLRLSTRSPGSSGEYRTVFLIFKRLLT